VIKILEKIHSVGVIHRDIKPDHFLFWKNEWYLIDFGFATFSLATSTDFSRTREYIIGTPNYISIPIHNGFSPTARDDLISLGYIFLESLAIRERLPWSKTVIFPNEASTEYTECHILHVQNQYKKKYKEKWENENPEHWIRHYLHDIYSYSSEYQEKCIYTKLINRIKQYK
jgi:serine/threonine protein kinase